MSNAIFEQQGEEMAAIADRASRELVSKARADRLGPVEKYPRTLAWWPNRFGVTIEADGNQWLIAPGAPIMPGHLIQRLIRDEFNAGLAGSC